MIAAARLPARSEPANSQFFLLCRVQHNRKNWLFAGTQLGGQRAAAVMSLIQSAKLSGLDPYAYLRDVLTRQPTHKASRISELLPHRWASGKRRPCPVLIPFL